MHIQVNVRYIAGKPAGQTNNSLLMGRLILRDFCVYRFAIVSDVIRHGAHPQGRRFRFPDQIRVRMEHFVDGSGMFIPKSARLKRWEVTEVLPKSPCMVRVSAAT